MLCDSHRHGPKSARLFLPTPTTYSHHVGARDGDHQPRHGAEYVTCPTEQAGDREREADHAREHQAVDGRGGGGLQPRAEPRAGGRTEQHEQQPEYEVDDREAFQRAGRFHVGGRDRVERFPIGSPALSV